MTPSPALTHVPQTNLTAHAAGLVRTPGGNTLDDGRSDIHQLSA
jgi:hypothetical protein